MEPCNNHKYLQMSFLFASLRAKKKTSGTWLGLVSGNFSWVWEWHAYREFYVGGNMELVVCKVALGNQYNLDSAE